MADRPILFSAPMVRAILAGAKTQTRRLVKPQPTHPHFGGRLPFMLVPDDEGEDLYLHSSCLGAAIRCPYGRPGTKLWVREAWRTSPMFNDKPPRDLPDFAPLHYGADNALRGAWAGYGLAHDGKYRPPMFMPRWASRITLEVTGVRVERLQDISEADAVAEGVLSLPMETRRATPRADFMALWDSINGAGSWGANPWVWVLEFRRAKDDRHG